MSFFHSNFTLIACYLLGFYSSLIVGKQRSEEHNTKRHQLLGAFIFSKADALLVAPGSA